MVKYTRFLGGMLLMTGLSHQPAMAMANPAAEYCLANKYQLVQLENVGICTFSDNSYCEEWSYYRGECFPQQYYWPNRQYHQQQLKQYCLTKSTPYQIVLCTEQAARLIQAIRSNNQGKIVDLSDYKLAPEAVNQLFAALKESKSVDTLIIKQGLATAQLQKLAELLQQPNSLTYLVLQNQRLSQPEILILTQAIAKHGSLKELSLANNDLTDDMLQQVLPLLLQGNTLQTLDLSANQLSDAIKPLLLNSLAANKALLQLNLSFNPLTDITGQALLKLLQQNLTLLQIGVQGTKMSKDVVTNLEAILKPRFRDSACLLTSQAK